MNLATVLVTRPRREATRWVEDLRAAGIAAEALPLIAIEPLADPVRLRAEWQALPPQDAWMFVSAAAAEHFLRVVGSPPSALRCWATGPGTAAALRAAGVPAEAIDLPPTDAPQFDSEQLLALVRPQLRAGMRVLIVRGADAEGRISGRDWLARRLAEAGAICSELAAYRRLPAPLDGEARRLAAEGAAGRALFLFSSSEAVANLRAALPDTGWQAACALATHERIGEAARGAGFGSVRVCRPTLAALVASIESFE